MEEINANPEFSPQDPSKDINAMKHADAFAQMADEISMSDLQEISQSQSEERVRPKSVDMKAKQAHSNRTQESLAGIQGPKYMEALNNVIGIADIRAIETTLPILKVKVEVSPLSGKEEQALRTASVSPESFLNKLNELLYNHTKFSDRTYGSYNEFLANLFPPDKSVLIWALMSSTYLVLPTVEKECDTCEKKYIVDASPSDIIHGDSITKIWDKPLSPNDYTVSQEVLGGYLTFELGMPSERERLILSRLINPEKAKGNLERTGGLLSYTDNLVFFTKVVTVGDEDDKIVLTDIMQDIHPFLSNIPPKISDAVKSTIDLTIFDEYMPEFYLEATCSHCKAQEKITVDPEIAFFRKAISL